MLYSDYPVLGAEIVRARKHFKHPLLTSKPANMTQEGSNHHASLSTINPKVKGIEP